MRIAFIAICGLLGLVPAALAGEYTVYACRADEDGRNRSWTAAASPGHMTAYSDGCGPGGGGLVARASVEPAGSRAPAFDAAAWSFAAPAGSSISQVALSGRLYRAAGGRWGVGLTDQANRYLLGGVASDAMSWESAGYSAIATPAATSLKFGVFCADGAGCATSSTGQPAFGYARARADLYGVRVRISDTAAPATSSPRGSLAGGSWVGGTAGAGIDAADPVGVAALGLAVSSVTRTAMRTCDYALPAPCPTSSAADFSVDTRTIPDGEHPLALTATDTAGNTGYWFGTARIDNTAPGSPSQPLLQGAPPAAWRPANGFLLEYRNPSREGGAPLTSRDIQLCPSSESGVVDPSRCSLENRPGAPGSDTVTLPRPGIFRMRVRANDALYAGDWSPWSDLLRFDDRAPGTPSAAFPAAWVNSSMAGGGLALAASAGATPVSGITRYVVSGVGEGAITVDASSAGSATLPWKLLPEGTSDLSVRAVSGAGLATEPALAARGSVRKDITAPGLTVSGAPPFGSTVAREVTLLAVGTDAVSGMAPAPPDRPPGEGGSVAFTAPGGAVSRFRGDTGQLSPGEGSKAFSVTATDVAGNTSVPAAVAYTQDTRVPTGGLLPAPGEAPATIRFLVSESCAGRSAISISDSPGSWTELPTGLSDGVATARVPAPIWDEGTPYTLRAQVIDCAGNEATLDRWAAGPLKGSPIGQLTPPRRGRTSARASLARPGHGAHASSSTRTLTAQVRGPDGKPLAGARVFIEARPRASGASWALLAEEATSHTGRVSRAVRNGHSQSIRLSVAGTDLLAPSVSNVLTTTVRAGSTIAARPSRLRNGSRVTIAGRLRGGYVPARFELTLFGRAPGSRSWVPVLTPVAVTRSGRWQASYRFTKTRARSRYLFRVRIPSRPDYPFASGYSDSRAVTVLPAAGGAAAPPAAKLPLSGIRW